MESCILFSNSYTSTQNNLLTYNEQGTIRFFEDKTKNKKQKSFIKVVQYVNHVLETYGRDTWFELSSQLTCTVRRDLFWNYRVN